MAGQGPPPKNPHRRARGARGETLKVLDLERIGLPELPPNDLLRDGEEWHPATLRWWKTWVDSPLANDFTSVDVANFEEIAVLHAEFMLTRKQTIAAEIRLRMMAYGVDAASRARLRITMADADEKDDKRAARKSAPDSRKRYGDLRVVGEQTAG